MEVQGKRRESDKDTYSDTSEKVCEPCQGDNITKQASGFCKDCGECMCNDCFKQHLRVRSCRNHVLVDVDKSLSVSVEKCKQHSGEPVKFFCRKHDVVGCEDCMIQEHGTCQTEFIKKVSRDFLQSEDFKNMTCKVEKLKSVNKEIENFVQENKENNKIMLQKSLEDIRKFRIGINEYLDRVEAEVISKAKEIMSENENLLTEVEQECKQLSSQIEEIQQKLDSEILLANLLFINAIECKPKVSAVERAIAGVQAKQFKKFQFLSGKDVRSIVDSSNKFGTVDVTSTALYHQIKRPNENVEGKGQTSLVAESMEQETNREIQESMSCQNSDSSRDEFDLGYMYETKRDRKFTRKQKLKQRREIKSQKKDDCTKKQVEKIEIEAKTRLKLWPGEKQVPEDTYKYKTIAEDETCYGAKESTRDVTVGARVRRNNFNLRRSVYGTVKRVYPDGRVHVMWDDGRLEGPYTVGTEYHEVTLF